MKMWKRRMSGFGLVTESRVGGWSDQTHVNDSGMTLFVLFTQYYTLQMYRRGVRGK